MAPRWLELVTGSLEEKKQYRQCKARIRQLPPKYRAAAEAVERYLMVAGGIAGGDVAVRMYRDLVDLFEQSAANGTPIHDIVGDDPVEFVETFLANYSDGSWINKERRRLTTAIEDAEGEDNAAGDDAVARDDAVAGVDTAPGEDAAAGADTATGEDDSAGK